MGWRLQVVHTTQVSYTAPVRASFNEARMTPLTLPAQVTLESRITAGRGFRSGPTAITGARSSACLTSPIRMIRS